ncbi:DUF2332 domain-containing protein [Glacieibacterium megasporae]|uniref:DUF2332 domain-containing protein n=1 Tax=Glacieibacterium megasporae TaxID=2835787 RepID=UPI001CAA5228|nr:DUF2332 family protein [Polymorphobacter megasporae]UAJ10941.1 DUF2332 family protein [Polymorphobacter megasporae]
MTAAIRQAFADQADWARRLDAPFTEQLCETLGTIIDESTETGRRVLGWRGDPRADALVLRLLGGLNAMVRGGEAPALAALYPPNPLPDPAMLATGLGATLADPRLLPWLDSAPQTNEVARSGMLMPGMMVIAAETRLPLRLFELGASAGLNLRMDGYRYDFAGQISGPDDAPLTLAPAWQGPPPPLAPVIIIERCGVDLAPVDVRDQAGRARLLAYVWPDQTARIERLSAAMAAFANDPAPLNVGDAAPWVEQHVALRPGTATVVYHSIAWQYFPHDTQARIAAHLTKLAATTTAANPLAWLRCEFEQANAPRPTLRLTMWPGGEDRLLAYGHPHGATVEWLG